MFTALLIAQVLMGLTIIGLVLLQQGKGADMGAAFGAGASGTVFGAGGGGSFFTRATAVLAALFFMNSILLSSPVVRSPLTAPASVTEAIPVPVPAAEVDVPDLPADGEALELDMAPVPQPQPQADLPEVPAPAAKTESDLPE